MSQSAAADVKRFQGIIAMLQSDKNALALELKLATTSRDELQKKLNEREGKLNEKLNSKEADVEALRKTTNEQITSIESLRKRVLQLNDKLGAAEGETDSLRTEAENSRRRAIEVEDAARSAANLANRLSVEVEQLREEKVTLAAHLREQQANLMRQREESIKARNLSNVEVESVKAVQEGLKAENKKISDVIRALMLELSRSNAEHDALLKKERKFRAVERLAVAIEKNRTKCEKTAINRWRSVTMAYALKDAGEFSLGIAGNSNGASSSSTSTSTLVSTLTASSVAMSLRVLVRSYEQSTSMLAASKNEMRKLASEYQSALDKLAECESRVVKAEADALLQASEAASERAKAMLAAKHLKHLRNSLMKTTETAKVAIERRIQAAVNVSSSNNGGGGGSSFSSSSMSITPMHPSSAVLTTTRSSLSSAAAGVRLLDSTPLAVHVSSSSSSSSTLSRMSTGGGGALAAAFAAMGNGGNGVGLPPRGPTTTSVARFGAAKGAHRLLDPDGEAEIDDYVPAEESSVNNNSITHTFDRSFFPQHTLPLSSSSLSSMSLQTPHRIENVIETNSSNFTDETAESEAADPWIESAKLLSHLHAEQQKSSLLARELENARKECVTLENEVNSLLVANEAAKESENAISAALESEAQRRLQLQGIVKRLRLFYPADVDATIAMVTQALRSSSSAAVTKASSMARERKEDIDEDKNKAGIEAAEALLFEFASTGSLTLSSSSSSSTTVGFGGKEMLTTTTFSPRHVSSSNVAPLSSSSSSSPNELSTSSSTSSTASSLTPLSYLQRVIGLLHSRLNSTDVQLKEALDREGRLRKERNKLSAECETAKLRAAGQMTQLQSLRDNLAAEESNAAASAASVEARLKILPALHAKLMEALASVETHRKATADALAGHALVAQEYARLESVWNSLHVSLSEEQLLRSRADRALLELKESTGLDRAKFADALGEAKIKENEARMEADRVKAELTELEKSVNIMHSAHLADLEKLTEAEENVARCRFEADEACSKASDLESFLAQEKDNSRRALIELEQNAAKRLHEELLKCEQTADEARRNAMSALASEHEERLKQTLTAQKETIKRYSEDAERMSEEYLKEVSSLKDELDALQKKCENAETAASVAVQEKDRTLKMVADLEALGKTQNASLAAALSALQKREKDIEKLKVATNEAEAEAAAAIRRENDSKSASSPSSSSSSSSNTIASLKSTIARLTSQIDSSTSFCNTARSDLDATLTSLKSKEDEVLSLREQVAVLGTRLGRTQSDNLSVVQDCVRIGLESGGLSKRIDALSSILAPALLAALRRVGSPAGLPSTTKTIANAEKEVKLSFGIDHVQEMSRLLDPPSLSSSLSPSKSLSSSLSPSKSMTATRNKDDKFDEKTDEGLSSAADDDSVQSRLTRALKKSDELHSAFAAASLAELRIALTQALDETSNAKETVSIYEKRCKDLTEELEGVYGECLRLTEEAVARGDDVTALIIRLREREDELAEKEAAFAAVRAATDSPKSNSNDSLLSPSTTKSSDVYNSQQQLQQQQTFNAPSTPRSSTGTLLATIFEAPNSEDSSASSHHSQSPATIGSHTGGSEGIWNENRLSSLTFMPTKRTLSSMSFGAEEDDVVETVPASSTDDDNIEPDTNANKANNGGGRGGGDVSSILVRLGVSGAGGSSTPKTLRGKRAKLEPESPIDQHSSETSSLQLRKETERDDDIDDRQELVDQRVSKSTLTLSPPKNSNATSASPVKLKGVWAEIFPEAAAAAAVAVVATSPVDISSAKVNNYDDDNNNDDDNHDDTIHSSSVSANNSKQDSHVTATSISPKLKDVLDKIERQQQEQQQEEGKDSRYRKVPLTSMTIVNAVIPTPSVSAVPEQKGSPQNVDDNKKTESPIASHHQVVNLDVKPLSIPFIDESSPSSSSKPPSPTRRPPPPPSVSNSSSTSTSSTVSITSSTQEKKKAVHFSEDPPRALSPPSISPMTVKDQSSPSSSSPRSVLPSTTTITSNSTGTASAKRISPKASFGDTDGDDFFATPKKRNAMIPNPSSYSLFNDYNTDDEVNAPTPMPRSSMPTMASLSMLLSTQQQKQQPSTSPNNNISRPYYKLPPVPVLAGPLKPLMSSSPTLSSNSERPTAEQIAQAEFMSPTALEDRRKVAEILALLGEGS